MTIRKRSFFSILLLPLLLVACSSDDGNIPEKMAGQVLRFTASVNENSSADGARTRAWADAYNNSLPESAPVYIFLYGYKGDGSGDDTGVDISASQYPSTKKWIYETVGTVDLASGKSLLRQLSPTVSELAASDPDPDDALPKFPETLNQSTAYIDVFGVYLPPNSTTSPVIGSLTPANTNFTFSVPTSQTTEADVKAGDLLTSDVAATFRTNSSAINLEMKHRMAKVLVEFNATEDLTADNMPNNTYSVENVQTSRTVTLKTGEVANTESTTTITAKVGEPFFMPPQTISANTEFLKFDLRNVGGAATGIRNVTFTPSADMTFNEGVYYILTLNIGVRYITLTTTIRDWTGETILFDKIIL